MPSSSGLCGVPGQAFADIHAAMTKLVRRVNPSLIVLPDPGTNSHRKLIVELAAPYQLPAIHALRAATVDGALMRRRSLTCARNLGHPFVTWTGHDPERSQFVSKGK